jgi:general secretion pathway protein G
MKKAFTMVELVFVIVVIGILSAIAVPKFAATRDDALVSRGKSTLSAVRNSIATERQKRILRGDFTAITNLSNGGGVFSKFSNDKAGNANDVLEYPPASCTNAGCWSGSGTSYVFHVPDGSSCTYTLGNNKLTGTCSVFGD